MKSFKYILITLIVMIDLVQAVINVLAVSSPLPLGARCRRSHECEIHMGCRKSNRGDFKICKITVPGVAGCAISAGENMCADKMVCQDNRCKSTYGLEDLEKGKFRVETGLPPKNQMFRLPNFLILKEHLNLSTAQKIFNLILAILLLIGLTFGFKGFLIFKNALGFIPQERQGLAMAGVGIGMFMISIFLWIVVVVL